MSVLTDSDIAKKYVQAFSMVAIDFQSWRAVNDPAALRHPEVGRYNPKMFRPVIVVLDSSGNEVFKSIGGFNTMREAGILADFISQRKYQDVSWREYLAEKNR